MNHIQKLDIGLAEIWLYPMIEESKIFLMMPRRLKKKMQIPWQILFKAMIDLCRNVPKNVILAELTWQYAPHMAMHCEIRKRRRYYDGVVSVEGQVLRALMIQTEPKLQSDLGERTSKGKMWRMFTATDIVNFVETVRDENPRHRHVPALVPGMLLLQEMGMEAGGDAVGGAVCSALRLRLQGPCYQDERIVLRPLAATRLAENMVVDDEWEEVRSWQGMVGNRLVFTATAWYK